MGTSPFYLSFGLFFRSSRSRLFDFLRRREERILFGPLPAGASWETDAPPTLPVVVVVVPERRRRGGFFISACSDEVLISGCRADEIVSCLGSVMESADSFGILGTPWFGAASGEGAQWADGRLA